MIQDATTRRETLSLKQLEGMLIDLKAWKSRVINEGLNMDVNIINDDIQSMENRISDIKTMR